MTTPSGKPTSCMIFTSSITASGFCDAGRTTTVLPIASAGPSLPAMLTIGKLYGVMHATTPTGARRTIAPISPPGAERGRRHLPRRQRDDVVRLHREPRVRLEARPRGGHLHLLADRRGATGLGDHERQQVLEARLDRVGRLLEQLGAVPRASSATTSRTPRARTRAASCACVDRRFGRLVDDLFRRRVHDVVAAVRPVDPFPADQQLPRRHGMEV